MKDRTPRRILVAIDFSPASRRALRYATDLAIQNGAMLDAVHVLAPVIPLAVGPEPVAASATMMLDERVEVVRVVGDVLARKIAMHINKLGDLRLHRPVDPLDERNTKLAEIDAPDLHRRIWIAWAHVVDPIDQRAALNLDMEPGPLFNLTFGTCVGDMVDLLQVRHRGSFIG